MSTACASLGQKWKALVSGSPQTPPPGAHSLDSTSPSFSSQPNMMVGKERKYKRVTKDNFSDDQGLQDSSGSLWRKEGQGSYLFSQNNLRVIGDIVNVNVEGKTAENLDTKLKIIKQALARLEAPPPRPLQGSGNRQPANNSAKSDTNKTPANNAVAQVPPEVAPPTDQNGTTASGGDHTKEQDKMKFEPVPCRIVEKNTDGSYRVKGQQTVYVGRHEYRLVVTGILQADDISDGAIASGKLLDSKFDLLASNKDVRNDPIH